MLHPCLQGVIPRVSYFAHVCVHACVCVCMCARTPQACGEACPCEVSSASPGQRSYTRSRVSTGQRMRRDLILRGIKRARPRERERKEDRQEFSVPIISGKRKLSRKIVNRRGKASLILEVRILILIIRKKIRVNKL